VVADVAVEALGQQRTVRTHQHGADGHLVVLAPGPLGQGQRVPHPVFVGVGWEHFFATDLRG
jgi:hypothetical protein